jgi:glycosyltransferase involved in cell wall biosynthesis
LGRIARKLVEFARGPVRVSHGLWVFTPIVLPFPHNAMARRLNREILKATIRLLRLRLGVGEFHLWTFLPNVADYVHCAGESLAVYYCVDEWSMFSYIDRLQMEAEEHRLLERVDCVFAVTQALAERKRATNPETHLSPHGVDHELFVRALAAETLVPADLAALPKPVIGFYGTIQDWVDFDLVAYLATAHPEWSLVLLGQVMVDTRTIAGFSNVHLLGRRHHRELPAYCKGFDVGLIPYRIDERMPFVNPIKLREYLSAGVPVVSTAVPEVVRYARWCSIGHTYAEFAASVERALAEDSPQRRLERSAAMQSETWQARVAAIASVVEQVAVRKRGRT